MSEHGFWIILTLMTGFVFGAVVNHECKEYISDSQVVAGEWKIELQTPPCGKTLQVVLPKESGYPTTLVCDYMPGSLPCSRLRYLGRGV